MVRIRKGMVEAVLLPFLDILDLVRFSGLFRDSRMLFSPEHKKHINFHLLFQRMDPDLDKDVFKDCDSWLKILQVCT